MHTSRKAITHCAHSVSKSVQRSITFLLTILLFNLTSIAQPTGFSDGLFLDGWNQAVGLTFDANGRMFVWEKRGQVWIVENGVKSANPLINIQEEVGNWRDFGLVGFALDPDFLTNGYFYLCYVVDRHHLLNFGTGNYDSGTNEYFDATIGRVTRYQADVNTNFTTTIAGSRQVLLGETKETGMPILHESHGVGSLVFGEDRTLMVCMGDGASYSSKDEGSASETYWAQALADGIITPNENVGAYRCQILNSHNGKIFRLDPETGDGLPSNPFFNPSNPRSAQSRVWSLGVRNPYRMTKRPGTGSHNPEDADPGDFYFGDVGWGTWEDLNVISAPGQNFGWPKYEGITHTPGYNNPVYQPSTHERPKIDFRHGSNPQARGVIADGSVVSVGSAQLPGNQFNGNASTGGVFYTHDDFPATWQNTYFHADYSQGWIRNFVFDADNNPVEVREFMSNVGPVVHLGTHPVTGGLYYVKYPSEIRRIQYVGSGNLPPVARASFNINYGPSQLVVDFKGDSSFDPENSQLTYLWDFGDGNTSTSANPVHIFTNGSVTTYTVTLTVTDDQNQTNQTTIPIYLNNTPPQIISTSIDNVFNFDPTSGTNLTLSAVVNDTEHPQNQLTYEWETSLFHNDHSHAEPIDNNASTTTFLSPIGCDGATSWYRVKLTVSDPTGLSSTYIKDIFPNCSGTVQTLTFNSIEDKTIFSGPFSLSASASSGLPTAFWIVDGPATLSGNTITLTGTPGTVTIRCTQPGDATYAPALPVEQTFEVRTSFSGACGAVGSISREIWTGISGTSVTQIPLNTTPNFEDTRTIFEAPVNILDNYGTRMRGYFCPPETGDYTFWIASDDNGELWISTDSDPANKIRIATVPGWTSSRQWDKYAEQQSLALPLVEGNVYYIEALMKEQGGGDNLAVGWQLPSGTLERPIPGFRLSPFSGGVLNQAIVFPEILDKSTNDAPFGISAAASSGLPVSFSIVSGPATISGSTISLNGTPGTVIVRASQSGNTDFNPAPNVEQSFEVIAPQPVPSVVVTSPLEGETITGPNITVQYDTSGNWSFYNADHLHFILDGAPHITVMGLTGSYTLNNVAPGPHTLTVQIASSAHQILTNPEASFTVNFSVSDEFITFSDETNLLNSPNDFNSGVAMGIADMNGDGLDDIIRLNNAQNLNIQYQNAPNTPFSNYNYGSVSNQDEWSLCVADVDENGFNDILISGSYNDIRILKANGNGSNYSATVLPNSNIFIQGSNFVDINNDGSVDVFACHDDAESRPFQNDGSGNFTYTPSLISTATVPASDNSGSYASIWTDYDNDGDLDLYISKCRAGVASPTDPRRINMLFQNDGANNFTEAAEAAGLKIGAQSWTTDFADIDNDGDLDCYIINHDVLSQLMENNGDGTFTDITATSGLIPEINFAGIQAFFKDFDNDGFVDLAITGTDQRLFKNNGDKTFTRIADPFNDDLMESMAIGDLNHDGFVDIYAGYANLFNIPTTIDDRLFMNSGNSNNWFAVNLVGTVSNVNGIGARIELHGTWGKQIREMRSGEGYGVMNSFTRFFGIGTANAISKVVVKWPSGLVSEIQNPSINQFLTITESAPTEPTVSINSPTNNEVISGSTVTVNYQTSGDFDFYNADRLEFFLDGNSVGSETDLDGIFTLNNVSVGSHVLSVQIVEPDGTPLNNNGASDQVNFEIEAVGGNDIDLELTMVSSPSDPVQWSNFTVTATLTNTGSSDATGVALKFPKPDELVFQGGSPFNASQGFFDAFGSFEWSVGTVPAGASATLEMNFFLLSDSPFFIYGQVTNANGNDVDSSPNNGTCCAATEDDEFALPVPDIGPQDQTITFPIIPSKESDEPAFSISASATSGLPVSFQIVSGPATISGNTITLTGNTGLVTVRASQAGNSQWNPAPDVERIFNVTDPGLQDQTIAFSNIPNKITTDPSFTLNATASSGLPVSFQILSGPATLSGNTLTLDGTPGMVTVRASQGGNSTYNAAPDIDRTFNVTNPPGQDDIDLELSMATSNQDPTPFSVFTLTTTITNNSQNEATNIVVNFEKPLNTVFTGGNEFEVSQGNFTPFGVTKWNVGTLAPGVSATLEANLFYLNADPATAYAQVIAADENDADSSPDNGTCCVGMEDDEVALTVPQTGPQNQTIDFPAIGDKESDEPSFTISATASSGLPVTFVVVSGPAIVSGDVVMLTGALGTVTIRAYQGGNADWNPAPEVTQSFNVIQPGLMNQTITLDPIPNKITTDAPFQVTASSSSGLPVMLVIDSGPATISGNTITLNGTPGTVTVHASQAGDATFNPAPDVTQSFTVSPPAGANDIDLEVSLDADATNLNIWSNVTFTVTVTNNGNVEATGVVLDVPIPTGLAYTNVSPSEGIYDLFFQTWNVGSLAVGQSETIEMVLFVLQNSTALDYFVEVSDANENDSDSTPGTGNCCTPTEDDEALWTLNPPGQSAIGEAGDVFSLFATRKGTITKLRWTTNMGENIKDFVVERATDGYNYAPILTRINEELTPDFFMTYNDRDLQPESGQNFYRVRQELNDGSFIFSNVQRLEFPTSLEEFHIFPNPSNDYVDINLRPVTGEQVTVKIANQLGSELFSTTLENAPESPYRIDLENFRDGIYLVLIFSETRRLEIKKLVISRF